MKLTVIGRYGPYAKGGGATSCYLVEEKNTRIVLDMGAGTLSRLLSRVDIRDIDAIFISHLHYDHTSDLLPLRYLLDEVGVPITIYTNYSEGEWYRLLFTHPLINAVNVDENSDITLKDVRLSFFKLEHPVTDYAIKIQSEKTIVYTGDTVYCDNLIKAARGADLIVADCAKPIGFTGPHMTVDKAVELYKETGTKILASHLGADYSPEEYFLPYADILVAEEGFTYEV